MHWAITVLLAIGVINELDVVRLVRDFGLPVVLVLFFVWASWKREEHHNQRMEKIEQFVKETLLGMTDTTTRIIADNTVALKLLLEALKTNRYCPLQDGELLAKLTEINDRIDRLDRDQRRGSSE